MKHSRTIALTIEGTTAHLELNRPHALNAFNAEMHEAIIEALDRIEQSSARVIVLSGAGRTFCTGQDLNDRSIVDLEADCDLGAALDGTFNTLVRRLVSMPLPIVTKVHGIASGAGANLAFATDIVIAGRSATFTQPFTGIGLLPDTGGTWLLPRLAGHARAMGMAFLADPVDAETAASWGLIWDCVDDDLLQAEADKIANRLARAPTAALAATKRAMRHNAGQPLEVALQYEAHELTALGHTADFREGVSAFTERRRPQFKGS